MTKLQSGAEPWESLHASPLSRPASDCRSRQRRLLAARGKALKADCLRLLPHHINGKVVPLSNYKGKVLLIANLASQSTYRDQISALNDLQNTYGAQGLVVIGIPSSEFGGKELKDAAAVRQYYIDKLHVAFPLFAPDRIRGVETIPLYNFLCDAKASLPGGELHWNFTKFIVDRDGNPLARYELSEDPADVSFHVTIESALAGKLKKQAEKKVDEPAGVDDRDE
jgi:glutathione peroxidase